MDSESLFAQYRDRLEDFWQRRRNVPRFVRQIHLFGQRVRFRSNEEGVLSAVDHCLPLYSKAPAVPHAPFEIQLVVQPAPVWAGPPPENLFDYIQYSGDAQWLMMQLGSWGHCYMDLALRRATAVLAPELAAHPELVALCLLNTVITNLFIASGYGMLHASCLFRQGRAVLLMAAHNSGKSTTALRLALAGYPLLCDSMIFLPPADEELLLLGFPVGKVKLREDMVAAFPQAESLLESEAVREETKYSFDLRHLDPNLVHEEAVCPLAIDLCLLARGEGEDTTLAWASRASVMEAVMHNSIFYDTAEVWQRNLASINRLIDRARWHHLVIGSEPERLVATIAGLWQGEEDE
jgi:hypothetical protein